MLPSFPSSRFLTLASPIPPVLRPLSVVKKSSNILSFRESGIPGPSSDTSIWRFDSGDPSVSNRTVIETSSPQCLIELSIRLRIIVQCNGESVNLIFFTSSLSEYRRSFLKSIQQWCWQSPVDLFKGATFGKKPVLFVCLEVRQQVE